ncbi:receptor-like protein 9DC1 [Gossypium hirsutum]|uniref:Receptor-like protein 9DC1 n=1 Tax=Gossypium hirsutum TaxID=3635 RepID=A0A1U8J5J1_GOSHI|nr:receptor-like protein 9DC1 [Gossypium hirsutum]
MASYLFLSLFLFFLHLYASFSSSGSHSCSSLIQFKDSFSIREDASFDHCDYFAGLKSYPKTNSWKEGTDCCSWDGVTCDHLNAHVIALDLSCSWLYGNFPSNTTLFLLPHLQKLNLAYNDFNFSKIPSEFGRFTSLFYLNLSNTWFSEVPSQVSHLSKLVSLDLSGFDELLTIDKYALEGLVHNLTEVRRLFLDEMDMSSVNAHVFMNLSSSLRSLSLVGCDLQGKFPKNIFDLPNLNLLNLGGNQNLNLDPLKFNRSSNLEQLIISDANICGGLPDSMGNLVSLKFLVLSHSNLSGLVPRSLGNLLKLTHLDL